MPPRPELHEYPGKHAHPAEVARARDGLIVDVVKVKDPNVSARRKLEEPFGLICFDIKEAGCLRLRHSTTSIWYYFLKLMKPAFPEISKIPSGRTPQLFRQIILSLRASPIGHSTSPSVVATVVPFATFRA
jgi:hypothetical protein